MTHAGPLVATLVVGLSLAFAFGLGARMLRLPPLLGYIAAGIAVGPHTPGVVADPGITAALAEIGVALLLFAVGLHFRARDLLDVWRAALPGALAQVTFGTLLGAAVGGGAGWCRTSQTVSEVLHAARPDTARIIVLATPEAVGCRRVLDLARAANPTIIAAARAHDAEEAAFPGGERGVGLAVMDEREIALGMAEFAMIRLGVSAGVSQQTVEDLRAGR